MNSPVSASSGIGPPHLEALWAGMYPAGRAPEDLGSCAPLFPTLHLSFFVPNFFAD